MVSNHLGGVGYAENDDDITSLAYYARVLGHVTEPVTSLPEAYAEETSTTSSSSRPTLAVILERILMKRHQSINVSQCGYCV
ncbi:hypothetical protein J6590_004786 [Homalodisca vitripennis]|nr:hypothetical protein J6590_004786 [Homalodisca vitripennis]